MAGTERTRPIHLVLGGWVAANGVLAGLLFLYHPEPISVALYAAAIVILSGFGLTVLVAARHGRVGAQRRIPVRGTTAAWAALGLALVGLGAVYGWVVALAGVYPLIAAVWTARRERIRPGARPWPAAPDGTPPAPRAEDPFDGVSPGTSVPVPAGHPAHRPPEPPATHPVGTVRAAGLAVIAVRTARALLRRR